MNHHLLIRDMRPLFLLFLALPLACALPAQGQAQNPPIIQLPVTPTPAEVKVAKAAFAQGSIVAMKDADTAKFGALFNVALPGSSSRHRQPPPCIMAAHITSSGQVRTYTGGNSEGNSQSACQTSFEQWVDLQSSFPEENLIAGWTYIRNIPAGPQYTKLGNQVEIGGSIYRANSVDTKNDYYLVLLNTTATPSAGHNAYQLYVSASAAANNGIRIPIKEYGPATSSSSFSLGNNIPYSPGLSGTFLRTGLSPGMLTLNQNQATWSYISYKRQNPKSSTVALIFQAPQGTSHFTLDLQVTAVFGPGNGTYFDNAQYQPLIPVKAPLLSVPAETYVFPGEDATINVQASSYLSWQVTATPNFVSSPDNDSGTGNGSTTFHVGETAEVGKAGSFSFDTSPASAAPQVPVFALNTAVYVNTKLPAAGVLLAGGKAWDGTVLQTAQVWNPVTGTLDPTNRSMMEARQWHTATLLLGSGLHKGQVLLAGGFGSNGAALASTEFFDPVSGIFTAGPSMTHAHAAHCAVQRNDGTVLIMGGADETNQSTDVVDVYDPIGNKFGSFPLKLVKPRQNFAAVVLQDGNVLAMGGTSHLSTDNEGFGDAETYDVGDLGFGPIPGMVTGRQSLAAVGLKNGQALVLGGSNSSVDPLRSTEVYTEASSQPFSLTSGSLDPGRRYPAVVVQDNGTVLVIGGYNYASWITSYDPASESFTNLSSMAENRDHPTAVLIHGTRTLFDGKVFVAGGVIPNTGTSNGELLELYDPSADKWSVVGTMNSARSMMTSTLFGLGTDSLPAQR